MLQIHVACCHPNYFKPLLKEYQWLCGGGEKYEKREEEWRTHLKPLQMQEVTEMHAFNMFLQAQDEQVAKILSIQFCFYWK